MAAGIYGPPTLKVVSLLSSANLGNYYSAASAALVLYDHVCTIPAEIRFMWRRKLTVPMILFHANRWLVMILTILEVVGGFMPSAGTLVLCHAVLRGEHARDVFNNLVDSYIWYEAIAYTADHQRRFSIGARACVIAADSIVLYVTWLRTWAAVNVAHAQDMRTPLMTMLFRDATGVHMFQHVIDTLTDGSRHDISRPSFVRDVGLDPIPSHVSSLRFVSFVGNLGESLVYDDSENNDLDVVWDEDIPQRNMEQPSSSTEIICNSQNTLRACVCRHFPGEDGKNEGSGDGMVYSVSLLV
ncbi:hypothetical protein CERSUDRAFT_123408 [Gelatoporia subvermispora B]|uniref:DUF6533 domain-containing protein n=1 Tax=Ceriporiopsis subvermispora (strain B) TaxID=914234 RepID=M2QKD4_CERS8|nr:hypothetical protein CERSUDRAFT_123408 [Gelatoporia subvermispora B]